MRLLTESPPPRPVLETVIVPEEVSGRKKTKALQPECECAEIAGDWYSVLCRYYISKSLQFDYV